MVLQFPREITPSFLITILLVILLQDQALQSRVVSPLLAARHNFPASIDQVSQPKVFVLLADGRLAVVHLQTGETLKLRKLHVSSGTTVPGHFMVLSQDKRRVFVLLPSEPKGPSRLVSIETSSTQIGDVYVLPSDLGVFRSLDIGSKTGRLYLFGNHDDRVVVAIVDPERGRVIERWTAREADGRNWWVYQGAVSTDERRLFISYHGAPNHRQGTSGIDWFDILQNGLRRCQTPSRRNVGCIPSHGGFVVHSGGLLVTTGDRVILDVDHTGMVTGGYDSGLDGNHLMEFAVDTQLKYAYAVGSCGHRGGFRVIKLTDTRKPVFFDALGWHLRESASNPLVTSSQTCGVRIAVDSMTTVIVGKTRPIVNPNTRGSLVFLDGVSGNVLRTTNLPSEPIDLLATR